MVLWAHPSLHPKRHVDRFSRRVSHYFTIGRYVLPQTCPFPFGDRVPHVTNNTYIGPTRIINPNGIRIGSAVFVWVANAVLYNALSMGKKTPKIAPSRRDFVTPPEEDRVTVIGNMQQKFGKQRACGSGDMLADRQTEPQTRSLQYFATINM